MLLSTFNPTQVASSVWTAAARTLTADPATDAGAATLVWARAVRTLTDPGVQAYSSDFFFSTLTTNAAHGAVGAWVQQIASLAHSIRAVRVCVLHAAGLGDFWIQLATGGAGSEVAQITFAERVVLGAITIMQATVDPTLFAKATRLSAAVAYNTRDAAETFAVALTWLYGND